MKHSDASAVTSTVITVRRVSEVPVDTEPLNGEQLLHAASEHVCYEVHRFREAFRLFRKTPEQNGKRLIAEALILHFRNLLDFFHVEPRKGHDDIVAAQFVSPGEWDAPKPEWFDDERQRCHKLLAHLTYDRVQRKRDGDMTWDFERMSAHVEAMWTAFLTALPENRRAWFRGWRF